MHHQSKCSCGVSHTHAIIYENGSYGKKPFKMKLREYFTPKLVICPSCHKREYFNSQYYAKDFSYGTIQ